MSASVPLCVDMDGTLLLTDTSWELFLANLKRQPLSLFFLLLRLARGRAHLKQELATRARLDPNALPLNTELLDFLRKEHQAGRQLILVTGADQRIAEAVANHVGLFHEAAGSDGVINLTGKGKARALVERFGKSGFDYAGNTDVDLAVWAEARKAIVVSQRADLIRKAKAACEVEAVFTPSGGGVMAWVHALRLYQWTKNLLIFVPLLGAHQWRDVMKLENSLVAFLAFSLCASSVYLLNDLCDLEADRHHPVKRRRPFASGQLTVQQGLAAFPILLGCSVLIALALPTAFVVTFATYYVLTFLYSLRLKQIEIFDVLTLASLYCIRVVAGGYAAQVMVSDWLLVFSIFVFHSLAFVKRYTELLEVQRRNTDGIEGRGYRVSDLGLVSMMGVVSGYLSVLVLALYITNPMVTVLYQNPKALWLECPMLLYWISRVWLVAHRGMLNDDPIVFALKDKQSWLVFVVLLVIAALALPK